MKMFLRVWQYLAEFYLEWEIFEAKVVQKNQNKHFIFSNIFPRKSWSLWDMLKNMIDQDRPEMRM